jgi:hypothetical protein
MLGTPLRFLYGHDVFTLRDQGLLDRAVFAKAVAAWQGAGRSVYWIGMTGGPGWPAKGLTLGLPVDYHFDATILEHAYDHKPTALTVEKWQVPLAQVQGGQ